MIATLDSMMILEESEVLGKVIADSTIAKHYQACKRDLQQDNTAQKLIDRFVKMKETYTEVQRFGKYHPDYSTVSTEVRVLKRELDLNETIAAFKQAEKELEELLNQVSSIVARSVSEHIKVPTGNPFFDNMSCGGGCGSGGGCSCK